MNKMMYRVEVKGIKRFISKTLPNVRKFIRTLL